MTTTAIDSNLLYLGLVAEALGQNSEPPRNYKGHLRRLILRNRFVTVGVVLISLSLLQLVVLMRVGSSRVLVTDQCPEYPQYGLIWNICFHFLLGAALLASAGRVHRRSIRPRPEHSPLAGKCGCWGVGSCSINQGPLMP